jgi:hypothetical protein
MSDIHHHAAPARTRQQGKQNIMTSFKFARIALPALAAAIIGLGAQAAVAQTTAAPAPMSQGSMSQGSMSGMNMAAPATTAPATATTTAPATAKKHHTSGHALPASAKFSSVATAQAHCPGEAVVWVNTNRTRIFHTASSKYFGKTKHGAYVCENSALSAGLHASKH